MSTPQDHCLSPFARGTTRVRGADDRTLAVDGREYRPGYIVDRDDATVPSVAADTPATTYRVPLADIEHLFAPRLDPGEDVEANDVDLVAPQRLTLAATARRIGDETRGDARFANHTRHCRGYLGQRCPVCGKAPRMEDAADEHEDAVEPRGRGIAA